MILSELCIILVKYKNLHGCEKEIKIPSQRSYIRNLEACRVVQNSYPKGWRFQPAPNNHYVFFFFLFIIP